MAEEIGQPILEELTQELEQAHQEILRLKGYTQSTGLVSSATTANKVVKLRGIAISEGTHNGKFYPWDELSKDSFVESFIGKPVVVDHKEGLPSEVGLVKKARKDPKRRAILVDLEIYDEARGKQALYLMENDRPVGLSVQVWEKVSHEDGREVARDLELQHLSLTMDPADKEARIVAKLSQCGEIKEGEMSEEAKEEIKDLAVDDLDKLASEVEDDEVLVVSRVPEGELAEYKYPYYRYPKYGQPSGRARPEGPPTGYEALEPRVGELEKRVTALEEAVKKLSLKPEEEHGEAEPGASAEEPKSEPQPAEAEQEGMSRKDEAVEEEKVLEELSNLHPADLIFLEQMAKRRERV